MDRRRLALALAAAFASPSALRAEEKKKAGGETYIPIRAVLGMTFRANDRRGVLSVDCGLDIPDEALRARAELLLPRLRAAYVQIVQAYAGGLPAGALPNADYLGSAFQQQTNTILGKPGARVLLGAIVVN